MEKVLFVKNEDVRGSAKALFNESGVFVCVEEVYVCILVQSPQSVCH